jgi:hypothetical protein
MKLIIITCLTFVLFSGCAAQEEMIRPSEHTPDSIYSSPKIISTSRVPIGETPPVLVVGTKYTFRQANAINKNWSQLTWVIKDIAEWQGSKCYVIDLSGGAGETFIVWDTNLNFMATINKDGKAMNIATPSIKTYSWPLKVGNSYEASYEYWAVGKKAPSKDQITVENITSTTVPSGTYSTFILKRISTGMTERIFYSPALGFPVKWQWSQSIDHPNGPGEFVVELTKIEK